MARKLNRNLAVMASAAIAAVYAAGFVATRSEAHHEAAAPVSAAAPQTAAAVLTPAAAPAGVPSVTATSAATTDVPAPTRIARAVAAATQPPTPTNAPASAQAGASRYRDGTYSGTGTSRRGDVTAQVTIAGGQITDVKITRSTTYYPTSDIARLPGQAVSRQSAAVDVVSGATESSKAFRGAVTQALAQASTSAAAPAALQHAAGAA